MTKVACAIALADIQQQVQLALDEDIGTGDLTAHLIPPENRVTAEVICREEAIICGCDWFNQAFLLINPQITIHWDVTDGTHVTAGQRLCSLSGPAQAILMAERTALNFLQTLSGTATTTQRYVAALQGSGITLLDTRKTIPGLRQAQKYAVRCGGGTNHRIGLFDGILIKENHIAAAGSIKAAVAQARTQSPPAIPIEVEVETLDELQQALDAGADILLLDNMDHATLQQAVTINQKQAKLELSGGVTLQSISSYNTLGVDFISVGSLTKAITPIDLSLRVVSSTP